MEQALESLFEQRIYAIEFRAALDQAQVQFSRLRAQFAVVQSNAGGLPSLLEASTTGPSEGEVWQLRALQGLDDLGHALEDLEAFWLTGNLVLAERAVVWLRRSGHSLAEYRASCRQVSQPCGADLTNALEPDLEVVPSVRVHRWNGVSRASFICPQCGWELGWSGMIESDEFLEVEMTSFECPICPMR